MKTHFLFLIVILVIVSHSIAQASESFDPWNFNRLTAGVPEKEQSPSWPALILQSGLQIYVRHISAVDGDRCSMYPSCSTYAMQAVKKHGFFMGWLLTVDRLIHEGNEMDLAPELLIDHSFRYLDLVSNNDFWWYRRQPALPSDLTTSE